jgi:ABC-type nitrate/sulfonate/bicarbonate transport system ATPase subunit
MGDVPGGTCLTATDLTLGHDGRPPVVERVGLSLAPGERVAIVGGSGSGKTTLLHGLAGLLRPQAGQVTVDGEVVASPSAPCSSRHAAYMFQRDLLLPWKTARDNAALAAMVARPRCPGETRASLRFWAREQAESHLVEFGLGDALHLYPHQLSGGMRQRVALARTLILGRELVLLDEPFAGLDALTRGDLQEWLRGVMTRYPATWVFVTHDIREAVILAGRVAVLGGRPAGIIGWVDTAADPDDAIGELRRMLKVARAQS